MLWSQTFQRGLCLALFWAKRRAGTAKSQLQLSDAREPMQAQARKGNTRFSRQASTHSGAYMQVIVMRGHYR